MKIKGDKVCNSTLKVVKLYVGAGREFIVGGTAAGRKGFILFHKLPKGIAVPWGDRQRVSHDALAPEFSFADWTWLQKLVEVPSTSPCFVLPEFHNQISEPFIVFILYTLFPKDCVQDQGNREWLLG